LIAYLENSLVRRTLFHFFAAVAMVAASMVSASWGSVMRAFCFFVAVFFGASLKLDAAVVNSADVGGYSTFSDTNTGRVWLDLDNFFDDAANIGTTGFDMITAAQSAGFTFATRSDVQALLNTLPLTSGEWATYAPVMGYGRPRGIMWGMYDDGNGNPYGWAWSFSLDTSWNYLDNMEDGNTIANGGEGGATDLGIWAYQAGNASVPEPSMMAIFGLGTMGLAYRARRKAKA
jgi:hypothetical protein